MVTPKGIQNYIQIDIHQASTHLKKQQMLQQKHFHQKLRLLQLLHEGCTTCGNGSHGDGSFLQAQVWAMQYWFQIKAMRADSVRAHSRSALQL